jgi:hypothetical protein
VTLSQPDKNPKQNPSGVDTYPLLQGVKNHTQPSM